MAEKLPVPPITSYFLCDSYYIFKNIIKAFLKRVFYTAGVLKTNSLIYSRDIKYSIREFPLYIQKTDKHVSLMTIDSQKYHIYRYEKKIKRCRSYYTPNQLPLQNIPKSKSSPCFYLHRYVFKHTKNPEHIYSQMPA